MATIRQTVKSENLHGRKVLREKLKQARTEAGLAQPVVAYMMGCSQSWLSKLEKSGNLDFLTLERLAAIYDKPLEWFSTLGPGIRARTTWAPHEAAYRGQTRTEWKQSAKIKQKRGRGHWPTPRGWSNKWLRRLYDYDVANYKGSVEYARIAQGEDFWSVFKFDGIGYVVTKSPT
jgi:transcriptional regulator with XRE-family HTH domain